jgi:hypothetical protein
MQPKLKAYTRHTWVLRTGARPSHPMAALSLLAIGHAMTRRDALPWDPSDALQKRKTQVRRVYILHLQLCRVYLRANRLNGFAAACRN